MSPMRPAQYRPTKAKPDAQRGTARQRGYTTAWDKARATFLKENPLCVECLRHVEHEVIIGDKKYMVIEKQGKVTAATVVDHIVPHRGDQVKFWDAGNWQSLCRRHHNAKTGRGE